MKLLRHILTLLLCTALLGPLYASAAGDRVYPDVPVDHWAEEVISKAGDYGLMQGREDGSFGLGRNLSRAEFVTMLSRMFGWTGAAAGQTYADVSPGKWYYEVVEQAAAAGVAEAGETFRPEEAITRREMAQMLISALGYDQIAAQECDTPFADVSGPGSGCLALAYDIGMVTGVESFGKLLFKPEDTARREEAAAMLVRVYERYTSKIEFLHGFYAFSSYSQIDLTAQMDGVSVGWARLAVGEDGTPWLNDTRTDGNEWVKPEDPTPATDVFSANGTPVNLNVFCDDADAFLTPEARSAAVAAITAAAGDYAGITMDVEGADMRDESVKEPYAAFLRELRAALPAGKTLYVCVPPDTWYHGYDYAALGEVCDKVILMAHDYQWTSVPAGYVGTSKTETPVTPITQVWKALRSITDPETGVADRDKIVLAISFANVGLRVDEDGLLAEAALYRPAIATVYTRLTQPGTEMGWSDVYLNPYLYYTTEDGGHYRLWYEDARSVNAKVQLARMFGINGISLWRLGNIPNYPDEGLYFNVWDSLLAQR